MKLLLLVASIGFSFSTSGQITFIEESYTDVKLDTVLTAEIGSKLIEKGKQRIHEAIVVTYYPKKESYLGNEINISLGDTLTLTRIDKKGKIFNDKSPNSFQGVLIVNNDFGNPKLFTHNPTLHPLSRKIQLKVSKTHKIEFCDGCFRKQFIYNGKAGNILKFTYREFIDNLARPSFTQELQYDLAEGNIVGLKGLRIEIIKATNLDIQYKVIKTFSE